MTTSSDIKAALHRHYNGTNRNGTGGEGEQYVCIEEARSGRGWDGNDGQCDFVAVNTFQSRGLEIIGHEIKVSASDWKAELANPEKAEKFARFCRRWYVVVPSELAAKMAHEVPPAWGLKVLTASGKIREAQKPTIRAEVEPLPWSWWVGWIAQIDRQHKRDAPRKVAELLVTEQQRVRDDVDRRVEAALKSRGRAEENLSEKANAFRDATGIDIRRAWASDVAKFGELWSLSRKGLDLGLVARHMREAADKLDAVSSERAA